MRNLALLAAGAALIASGPVLSQGKGNGNGGGGGPGHGQGPGGPGKGHGGPGGGPGGKGAGPGPGRGNGGPPQMADRGPPGKADRGGPGGPGRGKPDRGPEARADRGPPPGKGADRGPGIAQRGPDRGPDRGPPPGRGPDRGPALAERGPDWRGKGGPAGGPRGPERVRYTDGGRWYAAAPPVIEGCPPGLAKKGNGCLPPGQARRIWNNPQPYDNWYGNWSSYRSDPRYDYRYGDGYLYRVDSGSNLISAFLPLLGGALFGGNTWPQSYADYQVPQYYDEYYGYDDGLDYRYADGAILGVNPSSGAIDQIAALLTGNDWNVGQAMPAGYDFYNVPPQFRDRYADTNDAWYRYSDGYVYQVDPQSRLIEQAIQLLT